MKQIYMTNKSNKQTLFKLDCDDDDKISLLDRTRSVSIVCNLSGPIISIPLHSIANNQLIYYIISSVQEKLHGLINSSYDG